MGRQLHLDPAAEKEATDIGKKFMNSTDVVGDMSRAYGADLSSVRLHTDENAAKRTAERGVDAFSTGKDVFFAQGAFDKGDPASRGLLAHELSHSLQQGAGGGDMGGMTRSAPMGAEQGGLLDWFRTKIRSSKIKRMNISDVEHAERDTSEDAQKYMGAMSRNELIKNTAVPTFEGNNGSGGMGQAYADWLYRLQDAGLDSKAMIANGTITSAPYFVNGQKHDLEYGTGDGYDMLNERAFDILSNYAHSDAGMAHVKGASSGSSALETLSHMAGKAASDSINDSRFDPYTRRVAYGLESSLSSLNNLVSIPEDRLPKSLHSLRARYIALQEELDRKLMEQQG